MTPQPLGDRPQDHEEVVDTLLDLQRRLRGDPPIARSGVRPSRSAMAPPRPMTETTPDEVIVVDDLDAAVIEVDGRQTGADAAGHPEVAVGDDRVRALDDKIRRLEDDLSGVFETVGRLAESMDRSSEGGVRALHPARVDDRRGDRRERSGSLSGVQQQGPLTSTFPPVVDEIAHLAFLLGTWRGTGSGEFPTIDPFTYGEEIVFEHVGDAFLLCAQRSWLAEDGSPLHFERGFLRPGIDGAIELTLAHPLGLVEIAEGTVTGTELRLRSTSIGRTSTGDDVTQLVRRLRVRDDALTYELDMATERTGLTCHLQAELRRS